MLNISLEKFEWMFGTSNVLLFEELVIVFWYRWWCLFQLFILDTFWPKLGEGFYEERDVLSFQEDTTADLIEAFSDSSNSDDHVDNIRTSKTLSFLSPTYGSGESGSTTSPSAHNIQKRDLTSVSRPTKVSKYASALLRDSVSHDLQVNLVHCCLPYFLKHKPSYILF